MTTRPWVCIILGSDTDVPVMSQACDALDEAGVPYEMKVASAHRSPERTRQVITEAERAGAAIFIAGAGMAAHLPGVVASEARSRGSTRSWPSPRCRRACRWPR